MKSAKFLSLLLAVILVVCSVPLSVAASQVVEIDGERTAFISSFGKLIYNGKSYASYKTFDDALNALGDGGGRIVISGGLRIEKFNDISGRKKLTIVGVGANAMGNLIDFSGNPEIALGGDLALGNVNIKTDENACIITNGYDFATFENFDTYHTIKYVESGDHIVTYHNPPSIAVGNAKSEAAFSLTAGKYNTIIAGAADGYSVSANTMAGINDGETGLAVAGNIGNGVMNGNAKLVVNGGNVAKLVAGSEGGEFNGNITAEINGGKIDELAIGAASGAVINGSVVVAVNGGEISKFSALNGKISGSKIVITSPAAKLDLPSGAADYIITLDGGIVEPMFDENGLSGFFITDRFGVPAKEISLNGKNVASETSVYELNKGNNSVSVPGVITLALNKNADYVAGYEDGSFRPQNNMTKAEAVTLLTRLLVDENYIKGHIKSNFSDVEDGAWYESYIGLFEKLGYLDEISLDYGLKFAPNELITRGQFTQLIYEISSFATNAASMKLKSFSDVSNTHVFAPAIVFAVSNGIVSGYEDGSFRSENNITRAEVVTMVNRMLGRTPNGNAGENNFNDISAHWAKGQILAACNDENVSWTQTESGSSKYTLTGNTTKDYVIGLYDQSANLTADAIREGVDIISEQVKQNILNAPDTIDTTGKKVYYVSEKNGNDENNGLSPETAFKTLAGLSSVRFLRNAVVLFERGGIYRGQIFLSNNMSYGAYGTGPKPLLMQSKKNYADESLWQETEYPNVYVCTELLTNVGVIGFDHDLFDYSAASYDEKYGLIMNKGLLGFTGVQDMNKDLQFYSDIIDEDISNPCNLYLYSTEGNPGKRFKSIEIGEKFDIIDGTPQNVVMENLAFKFTGAHAIGVNNAQNFTVRNCVFSWLGGSLLTLSFFGGSPVNYGNAIETGTCDGYYLEDNWMYQLYDTGVTHQCSKGAGVRKQFDVRYTGNLIEYVHWGIEFYNSPEGKINDSEVRITDGVYDAYNICRFGGYGWGSIVRNRQNSAQLYCGSSLDQNKNQLTEYNIFDRCAGNLLWLPANSTEVDDKNIYIQTIGKRLGNLKGTTVDCGYDAAEMIEKKWGDKNAVVVVIDPAKEDPAQYNK